MAHPQLYRIRVDNFDTRQLETIYQFGHGKAAQLAESILHGWEQTQTTGIIRMELYKHNAWRPTSITRILEGRITDYETR